MRLTSQDACLQNGSIYKLVYPRSSLARDATDSNHGCSFVADGSGSQSNCWEWHFHVPSSLMFFHDHLWLACCLHSTSAWCNVKWLQIATCPVLNPVLAMDHDSVTQFVTAESRTFKRPGSVLVRNMESEFCHCTYWFHTCFPSRSWLPRNLKSCHFIVDKVQRLSSQQPTQPW